MIAKALLISADGNLCESVAGALSAVKSCDLEVLASFERSQSRLVSAEPSIDEGFTRVYRVIQE